MEEKKIDNGSGCLTDWSQHRVAVLVVFVIAVSIITFNSPILRFFHKTIVTRLGGRYYFDDLKNVEERTTMGINELEQLQHVLDNPAVRNRSVGLYGGFDIYYNYPVKHPDKDRISIMSAYNISIFNNLEYKTTLIKEHARSNEYTLILVEETVQGVSTFGGSNFRVEMRGYENAICSTQDYFNGRYRVRCPILRRCANLTIALMYINFDAFTVRHQMTLDSEIFKTYWCPKTIVTNISRDCEIKRDQPPLGNGIWVSDNSTWHWYEQRCPTKFWNKQSVLQCLKKDLKTINFVGDSHVRFLGDALVSRLMKLPAGLTMDKWADYHYAKVDFWWTTYADRVAYNIEKMKKWYQARHKPEQKLDTHDFVLISAGSWDMMHNGSRHYMKNAATMLGSIRQLKSDPLWAKANILFMNNVAFPPKHTVERYEIGFRSVFNLAAVNYWLQTKMSEIDIPVINAFSIVNFRYDENVCGNHFICYIDRVDDIPPHLTGTVGFSVADILLANMCAQLRR